MWDITTSAYALHVQNLMSQWHVPGLSIATFDDSTINATGFGLSCIEDSLKVSNNTIFDWGSSSKSLTSGSIGKLVDDQRLAWATVVSTKLPGDFVLSDEERTENVKVTDVLSHVTGYPRHDYSYYGVYAKHPDTPRSITRRFRNLATTAAIGAEFQYSNMMFTAASYLVEQISQQTFAEFLQLHLFDVLGMGSSYLQPSAVLKAGQEHRHATGYIWEEDMEQYTSVPRHDQPEGQGAGLIQSTVIDFARWVQAVMTQNETLFSKDIYAELTRPRHVGNDGEPRPNITNVDYALGWETMEYRGHPLVGHDGSEAGFRSRMYFLPEESFGVVVVHNADAAAEILEILPLELFDEILQVPASERVDWNQYYLNQTANSIDNDDSNADLQVSRKDLFGKNKQTELDTGAILSLDSYVGVYWNAGYSQLTLSIEEGALFIDASDRGMAFNVTFGRISDNHTVTVGIGDTEDGFDYDTGAFELDMKGNVQKMGLPLEPALAPELIWFEKSPS